MAHVIRRGPVRVLVWYPQESGPVSTFDVCLTDVSIRQETPTIDVSSFADGSPQYISGVASFHLSGFYSLDRSEHSLAEEMALGVLRGEKTAALALADLLQEEVERQALKDPPPSYDALKARVRAMENELSRLREIEREWQRMVDSLEVAEGDD